MWKICSVMSLPVFQQNLVNSSQMFTLLWYTETKNTIHKHCFKNIISYLHYLILHVRQMCMFVPLKRYEDTLVLLHTDPAGQISFPIIIRKLIPRPPWLSFLGGRHIAIHTFHPSRCSMMVSSESGSGQSRNYWSYFCPVKLTRRDSRLLGKAVWR